MKWTISLSAPKLFPKVWLLLEVTLCFLPFIYFPVAIDTTLVQYLEDKLLYFSKKNIISPKLSAMWFSWTDMNKHLFPQIGNWQQTTEKVTHKSSFVNQWVYWSYSRSWVPEKPTPAWVITQDSWVSEETADKMVDGCVASPQQFLTALIATGSSLVLPILGTSIESFLHFPLHFPFLVLFLCFMNLMTMLFYSRKGSFTSEEIDSHTPQRVLF